MIKAVLPITLLLFFSITFSSGTNASDGWVDHFNIKRVISAEKRKGKIATSVQCRNNPRSKVRLDPQIKITWKQNSADTEFMILLYGGIENWKPGEYPKELSNWKKVSAKHYVVSGKRYHCNIWHHKFQKASKSPRQKWVHASNSSGYRARKISQ